MHTNVILTKDADTHNLTIPIQNYKPGLGASYAIRPGNGVGLFTPGPTPLCGPGAHDAPQIPYSRMGRGYPSSLHMSTPLDACGVSFSAPRLEPPASLQTATLTTATNVSRKNNTLGNMTLEAEHNAPKT